VFQAIKSLTFQSLAGLTDDKLALILEAAGDSLDSLNVSHNFELSDATLSSIRQYNPCIKAIVLDGVKELTAAGLETMFTPNLEGLPPPPKLKVLKLSSVDHQAVTDEVLRLVTANVSVQEMTASSAGSYTGSRGGGGLTVLDIQGSSLVTDTALEQLVETSANTLEEINISYCPLITDQGLGYLVSKVGNQLISMKVWGCAQLSDDFFDGHDRINDRTLKIEGAWMKKSGMKSFR